MHTSDVEPACSIDSGFQVLCSIGLTAPLAQALARALRAAGPGSGLLPMRLVEVHRETVLLHDGRMPHTARLQPALVHRLRGQGDGVAVGDWLLARPDRWGALWVHERIDAATRLVRRDGDGVRHAIVANVDTALLVMGLDGDFNPRRIERYFAMLHGSGVAAVVVLTKLDLAERAPGTLAANLDALDARVSAGIEIVALDARHADATARLARHLGAGQTLVLLGSSGAGKSTLTNSLLGLQLQDTGAVRAGDDRGQHTTTARSLHRLPGGACVIDTPGVRTLGLERSEAGVAAAFDDIAALARQCRFRDCSHGPEPGCAVRDAVPADRLRNHDKLLREARRDTLTPLQRREQLAQWKARGRAGAQRARAKRAVDG